MAPIFKDLPLFGLEPVEFCLCITGISCPQHVVMGTLHNGDRVNLQVAQWVDTLHRAVTHRTFIPKALRHEHQFLCLYF